VFFVKNNWVVLCELKLLLKKVRFLLKKIEKLPPGIFLDPNEDLDFSNPNAKIFWIRRFANPNRIFFVSKSFLLKSQIFRIQIESFLAINVYLSQNQISFTGSANLSVMQKIIHRATVSRSNFVSGLAKD
jgi:hypothetical protein